MKEKLYFAYGSNMNLDQMEFRCPAAQVVGNVRLEDHELTFCSQNPSSGVANIRPKEGCHVDGVLWRITQDCEKSLDRYEGYPHLYGKETIHVKATDGAAYESMVYVMNAPHKDLPANPSQFYLYGILKGCEQNGISVKPVMESVSRVKKEVRKKYAGIKMKGWER